MTELGSCPVPWSQYDRIVLGHGGGGRLTQELVTSLFLPAFDNPALRALGDAAVLENRPGRLAITTDTFVVTPLFFPGGDIGSLAIYGTVNDLAVSGAEPIGVTAALVLEEGFSLRDLERIVRSMQGACRNQGVSLVAGDTKVVERGKADGLFITTTGIGVIPPGRQLGTHRIQAGDEILVSGAIGEHGVSILCLRQGIELETELQSDSCGLLPLARGLLEVAPELRCMRDATRGGVATVLNEFASASGLGIEIDEAAVPTGDAVRGACELLGLDPLYVANEGKLVVVVPQDQCKEALDLMRQSPLGREASRIGRVVSDHPKVVIARSATGGERLLPLLAGEQLPRIC